MKASPLAPLYRRTGWLLKRSYHVAFSIFVESCRDFGLRPAQYGCLRVLEVYPDIDQLTLGRLTGLDRSTVGLVIRILHKRGLITRKVDRDDRRRFCLRLSSSGRRILRDIAPSVAEAQARVLDPLPRAARGKFLDMLQLFVERHEADIDVGSIMDHDKFAARPASRKKFANGKRGGNGERRTAARARAQRRNRS